VAAVSTAIMLRPFLVFPFWSGGVPVLEWDWRLDCWHIPSLDETTRRDAKGDRLTSRAGKMAARARCGGR
jgi:hypothetical protein